MKGHTMPLTDEQKALADGIATNIGQEFGGRMKDLEASLEAQTEINKALEAKTEELTVALKSREHHGAAYVDGADDAFKTEDPAKRFSLARAACGMLTGWNYANTPYAKDANQNLWPERDILEAATQKAQSAGVDTEGGFAVPEQFNSEYIPKLRAKSILSDLGADFMFDLVGNPYVQPRIDTESQAYWVAENTSPTASDVELGQISMTPHELAALIPVSNRLLFQTSGKFESFLMKHMSRTHAIKLDNAGFKGTGAAGEPLGITNVAGVSTFNWTAVALVKNGATQNVTDKLSSMVETLDLSNALEGNLGWAMHPTAAGFFREAKDADGQPLLSRGRFEDSPLAQTLYGFKARNSTHLTAGSTADLIYGNFDSMKVGQWGTMILDSSAVAGNAFFNRQTWFRAAITVDIALEHEESFVIASNFDATA